MNIKIPIETSVRHIHLSKKDLETLFGKDYQLKKLKQLTLPEEFAAKETVEIQVNSKKISNLRAIGSLRKETQIELAKTDAIFLGINAPLKESGDLKGTPGAIISGPKGKIKIKRGIINTWRHIHCNSKEAERLGLKDGMLVSVKTDSGLGSITFHNVKVRIKENYKLCMHIDTDEGNAAGIIKKGNGVII
jgi:putative phosphotransacetylase